MKRPSDRQSQPFLSFSINPGAVDQAVQARLERDQDAQAWDVERAYEDDALAEWEDSVEPEHTWRLR